MQSWLPAIAYAPLDHGYWEPVTATLTWCEEVCPFTMLQAMRASTLGRAHGYQKYYATYYCAEVINTFTNLLFLYLSWAGINSCRKHGHDTVFAVAYFGYFLVGIGSFMFHTTLKCTQILGPIFSKS